MSANVIAIDGPAASGKSSVAKLIAERLHVPYVNTGALYRGQRTQPYPALPLLKYMKERGCRIILDSDSHSVEMLKGHRMLDALEHAKAAGYREDEIEKYPLLRKK